MKTCSASIAAACALLIAAVPLTAQTEGTTPPLGAMVIDLLGNSDTIVSVAFHRSPEFVGLVDSVSSDNGSATVVLQGSPGWPDDQFVYQDGVQEDTFFVQIGEGDREGAYYVITDSTADSVTIDLAGDDISPAVVNGTQVRVIPFWTLNTLFPGGEGVHASSSLSADSEVLLSDNASAGINLSSAGRYFYHDGSVVAAGWYLLNDFSFTSQDDVVLLPDTFFRVRHNVSGDTQMVVTGSVQLTSFRTPLVRLQADTQQDNFLGVSIPVDMTLDESGLFESGAFESSSSLSAADELLVFDNSVVGQNKSSSARYFHHDGTIVSAGWYLLNDFSFTPQGANPILKVGQGFIIRKSASPEPDSVDWVASPSYLDNY